MRYAGVFAKAFAAGNSPASRTDNDGMLGLFRNVSRSRLFSGTAASIPLLVGTLSCAPDTDLVGTGVATGGPMGGGVVGGGLAGAVLVDPAPGTSSVPLNLAAVLVRFESEVTAAGPALAVASGGQRALAGMPVPVPCVGDAAGTCLRLPLDGLLSPAATYVVSLGDGIVDGAGRPVPPGPVGQFVTASEPDHTPPIITGLTVEPSGPCVVIGFETNEPASAIVVMAGAATDRQVSAGAGVTSFSVAASLSTFGADTEVSVVVHVSDLAGNVAETAAVPLSVPVGLVPVAITEVHANAAGPEPGQEFVEIRNLGGAVLDLTGLAIEDAKAADVLPSVLLDGGAYALVVPASFDSANILDPPPRVGTPLIRVDGRIGSDGLANGGEVVRLRTADGTVVSAYGGWVDVAATKWAGKSVHRVPEDACDQPASWTRIPTAATPGWGVH